MAWAFFEASFFFIAPDFILMFFSYAKNNWKKILLITAGFSILGGIFYFVLIQFMGEKLYAVLINTPYIGSANILTVQGFYDTYGVYGTIFQSFTFMPFKIWTYLSVSNQLNPLIYFLFVMISRIVRFGIVIIIAKILNKYFGNIIRKNFIISILSFVTFFVLLIEFMEVH